MMFEPNVLFAVTGGYLCLLFAVAYYAVRRQKQGRSIVANPYVYSLSLAVYCTSWTFYGSVGKAATSGLIFMTIYLGPTLMALLWPVVLRKVITVAKRHRITTIADFIGFRYGNSIVLPAIVTMVSVVGLTPYMGLQIKAIISTFNIMTGHSTSAMAAGWTLAVMIGLFAMIFGVRSPSLSDKHEGLVFAVAVESIVKLVAFVAVGAYVSYVMLGGQTDIPEQIRNTEYVKLMRLGPDGGASYGEWVALMLLSMMAIMFLPRQFHVAVVENYDVKHINKAVWLFPLYLLLINVFVLPVAFGGLLVSGSAAGADSFVLSIPLGQGHEMLALLVFIGGFSAASGMLIVESLAISNMVMNTIVNPMLYRYNRMRGFSLLVANIKRMVILGLVMTGYVFAMSVGEFYSLVDMGLKSFEAVSIFAPAFLFGLYWKRGNLKGATVAIIAGFVMWLYTLMVPAMIKSGVIAGDGAFSYLLHSETLNPTALFGLKGLDRWSHSLFWGMFFNISLYVGVSIFTRQSEQEERQALLVVESFSPRIASARGSLLEIEDILVQVLGRHEGHEVVESFLAREGVDRQNIDHRRLMMLKDEAQRVLSGAIGASVANAVLEEGLPFSEQERGELLASIKQMGRTLRLSRQELAQANRELAFLKDFSENIIESLPLGVATFDRNLRVQYWNHAMENITGVRKDEAMEVEADHLFRCMNTDIFSPEPHEGDIACSTPTHELKGHISRLTGQQEGFVVVLEDITERKKIESELFLATKHASIGRLAAGVSHEIGNPLASISSLVQEMMVEDSNDFVKKGLGTINHHVNRIARIVRHLGDFARMYPREKTSSTLSSILNNTLELIRYDKHFKKIDVRLDVDESAKLSLDPDQIQQVFLNLILNARDAMPEGGSLDISIHRVGEGVEIRFSDTGKGIDSEIKDQIFDPFFSTKGPSRGTGLGLSISYSIIKDHNGSIEVITGPQGTTFVIRLPFSA